MRDDASIEVCAETLRLTLPLMVKHGIPVDPRNYAVWYEYASGKNENLKKELDGQIQQQKFVGNEATKQLYYKYFACKENQKLEAIQAAMGELASVLFGYAAEMDGQANRYGEVLTQCNNELCGNVQVSDVRHIISALIEHTESMRKTQSCLRDQLNESTAELEKLRIELASAKREAATDPLTGLLNRKGLERAIEGAIGEYQSGASPVCLMMIDIDHFKQINDRHGHLLGDKVLRLVGATLRESIKGRDTAARYGGEEFSVLLPGTPLEGAKALAEQIRASIAAGRILRLDNRQPIGQITVSIGVTIHCLKETPAQFIQRADEALYASKKAGRNRVTARVAA